MRIHSLSIHNKHLGWGFDNIKFNANLTLLVGASGVGKTQILKAVNDLKKITNGEAINGFNWTIVFSILDSKEFIWEGGYDMVEDSDVIVNNDNIKPFILAEKLIYNQKIIIERNREDIQFNGILTPKLSSTESIIYIFKEDAIVKKIHKEVQKITFEDNAIRFINTIFPLRETITTLKKNIRQILK